MLQQVLISSLRATGQYRSVTPIGSSARGDYILRGQLFSLYGVDTPNLVARFSMEIDLFDSQVWRNDLERQVLARRTCARQTGGEVVEAMDRDVLAGMNQFTANLGQYFAAHPPQTPQN